MSIAYLVPSVRAIADEEAPAYDGNPRRSSGRFAMIPEQVFSLNDGNAIALYAVLANHANQNNECWPSMATIEKALGWTETRIRPALKKLCDAGIVEIEKRKLHGMDKSNTYRLHANVQVPHDEVAVPHSKVIGPSLQGDRSLTTRDEQEPIELKPIERDIPPIIPQPEKPKPTKKRNGYSDAFEAFWLLYPSGHGVKKLAAAEWEKLDEDEQQAVMAALPKWIASDKWRGGFVRDAQRWLSYREWEGEPPAPRPIPQAAPKPSGTRIDSTPITQESHDLSMAMYRERQFAEGDMRCGPRPEGGWLAEHNRKYAKQPEPSPTSYNGWEPTPIRQGV